MKYLRITLFALLLIYGAAWASDAEKKVEIKVVKSGDDAANIHCVGNGEDFSDLEVGETQEDIDIIVNGEVDRDFDVTVMGGGQHHAIHAPGPGGITVISDDSIDESVQETIRSVLATAGHVEDVHFVDKSEMQQYVRVIEKQIEKTEDD